MKSCLFLFLLTLSALAGLPSFDFTQSAGPQGWEPGHDVGPLRPFPEGLVIPVTGGDAFLVSPAGDYRSQQAVVFTASLFSPEEGWAQLFFYQKGASEDQSLHVHVRAGWSDVAVPLPPLGEGWRLRLDFPASSGETILARVGVEEVGERGLTAVRAGAQHLTTTFRPTPEPVEIVELLPHQTFPDHPPARVVWSGEGKAGSIALPRFDGKRDRLYSGFLARSSATHRPLGVVRYAEEVGALAPDQRPFPSVSNQKGLQFQDLDDALALGIRHGTINVSLGALLDTTHTLGNPTWEVDGHTFSFNRSYLDSLPVRQLSAAGVNAYLILIAYQTSRPEANRALLHPGRDAVLPNGIAAFNTATDEGTRTFRAICEFLAHWYCREGDEHGRVAGFIVGNEVNAHWHWYNFGPLPPAPAVAEYERALRIAHTAVRTASAQARVYNSLTQHWTAREGSQVMGSRFFLEHLARVSRLGGDFDWRVAQHPYPENLFEPRFWNDAHATADFATPYLTFKNIEILPAFLARPEMLYRGQPRTVLLSEQGFHSDNSPAGDEAQAAAYCLAWEKITRLPSIEAFILHRHVDHKMEGGLNLGLWRRRADSVHTAETRRPIYDCFKAAGTPAQAEAFRFALSIVGLKSWEEAIPKK